MRDKKANVFLPWFPAESLSEAEKMLHETYLNQYERPAAYRYAICLKANNRPIGYVNLGDGDSFDLGYGLREEFWHKGLVTEAARAVVRRIEAAGIPYITATHDRNNPRSGQVMKKLGMQYKYSYEERWMPKNIQVVFRMYQLNFDGSDFTYMNYWNHSSAHYVEEGWQEAEDEFD